jgi:hypothetical protein
MAVIWTAPRPGEEGSVGHVRATLSVTNRADQILAERGLMRPACRLLQEGPDESHDSRDP